jgi:hypothetical protein
MLHVVRVSIAACKKVKSGLKNLKRFEIQIERYYNLKEGRLTAEEEDSDEIRERGVDRLEHLFEGVALVVAANEAACNEVGQPKGVKGRKFFNFVGSAEPVLPVVEVFVVVHAAHALLKKRSER